MGFREQSATERILDGKNRYGHASARLVDLDEFGAGVFHHPVNGVADKHPVPLCTVNGDAVLGPIPQVIPRRLYVRWSHHSFGNPYRNRISPLDQGSQRIERRSGRIVGVIPFCVLAEPRFAGSDDARGQPAPFV